MYKEYFQEPFLEATRTYYKAESQAFVANNSVSDYMRKAESRLDEELGRIQLYLNSSTEKEVCLFASLQAFADGEAPRSMRGGSYPGPC